MPNSGLGENSEAAARVHSAASLGSARECTKRAPSPRVCRRPSTTRPGRQRSGPKGISPRASELLQETTGDRRRPDT